MLNVLAQKPVDSEYVYLTIHPYQYMMHLILHCILDNLLDSANISLNADLLRTCILHIYLSSSPLRAYASVPILVPHIIGGYILFSMFGFFCILRPVIPSPYPLGIKHCPNHYDLTPRCQARTTSSG